MRRYHQLDVWRQAMELAKRVYSLTRHFPADERFGLVSQMRRCAISIPSNIAEGSSRGSDKEYCRFLLIARGSLAELETQVRLCDELGFDASTEAVQCQTDRVFGLINGLLKSLR